MRLTNDDLHTHELHINERTYTLPIKPSSTLLEVLRYQLDLIGTKQGCDKGDCGACTVLINGEPTLSCLSLAVDVNSDDHINTIDGLKHDDVVLDAFDLCGALQCGFCQPGMIMSAKALLKNNKSPSLNDIQLALSGNLCRCTGYTKIYLAILSASLVLNHKVPSLPEAVAQIRSSKMHLGET